jgi:GNAT superfamily N-acetyltransferase
MDEIDIAPASDSEARACLALLPEVKGAPVELLIARRRGVFAGAAALFWESWTTPAGFPVIIHVTPGERRHGVGRRLLAAAAELVAPETDGLWSRTPVTDDSDAAAFMRGCGFTPWRREHHFEAAIEALLADVAPKAERLRARGQLPTDLRFDRLTQAPSEEIARMMAASLSGTAEASLGELQARIRRDDDRSYVLICTGQVLGAVLCRIEDNVAVIDARVVRPRVRGGWANVLLLEAGLRRGVEEGLTRMRFHCDDTVHDTLKLAKRCAALETHSKATWYYPSTSAG